MGKAARALAVGSQPLLATDYAAISLTDCPRHIAAHVLEEQLQGQLDVTRIAGVQDAAEQTTGSRGADAGNREALREIRVVQRVEELSPELCRDPLVDLRIFKD